MLRKYLLTGSAIASAFSVLVAAGIVASIDFSSTLAQTSFPEDLTIQRQPTDRGVNQYLVYVQGSDSNLLRRVKTVVPDAFTGRLNSGQRVIQIGRFSTLNLAQRRVEELQSSGISAQIAVAPKVVTYSNPPIAVPIPTPTEIPITLPRTTKNPNTSSQVYVPVPDANLPDLPLANSNIKNRYFVIIPSTVDTVLEKAQSIVPTARLTSSDRGTYIEVQGYSDRASAETLNATMRSRGLDSRVIFN
jgi:hypothetical protein